MGRARICIHTAGRHCLSRKAPQGPVPKPVSPYQPTGVGVTDPVSSRSKFPGTGVRPCACPSPTPVRGLRSAASLLRFFALISSPLSTGLFGCRVTSPFCPAARQRPPPRLALSISPLCFFHISILEGSFESLPCSGGWSAAVASAEESPGACLRSVGAGSGTAPLVVRGSLAAARRHVTAT